MYIDVEDIETTTFIINKGSYSYMVMPYGYKKNMGEPIKRMVTSMLSYLLGKQWRAISMLCCSKLEMNFTRSTYKKALK